jgi:hypothetical protein
VAAHRLVLPVPPLPLTVLVALVGGDDDRDPNAGARTHGVQDRDRAHDVDIKCLARFGERAAHERLCGHVDDDLWVGGGERRLHCGPVTHVGHRLASHPLTDSGQLVQRWIGRDVDGQAVDARAHGLEPQREPAALEAGVAGKEHTTPAPESGVDAAFVYHERHGARPEAHSCSSSLRSRRVSIGCQNPSWRKLESCPSRARPRSGACSQTVASDSR